METKKSQNAMIEWYLSKGNTLTQLEALQKFGCFRLASRINDLRKKGCIITTTKQTKNGKSFALYKMEETNEY